LNSTDTPGRTPITGCSNRIQYSACSAPPELCSQCTNRKPATRLAMVKKPTMA